MTHPFTVSIPDPQTALSATTTARQAALLDQLVELFLAEGFHDFTLDDFAARLRCSKTTLYVLGGNKERLVGRVVNRYFETVSEYVEAQTATAPDPTARVITYLASVAEALRRASPAFMEDLAGHYTAAQAYEDATAGAAGRIRELITEGVEAEVFRPVHSEFVADTVAATMERIQSGRVRAETGLQDPEAYDELAELLITGIRR